MQDRFKFKCVINNIVKDVYYFYKPQNNEDVIFACTNIEDDKGLYIPRGLYISQEQLLQCTGKKDKHNNLIFEDDILKETYFSEDTDSLTSCLYKVEFDKDVSAFCFTELDGGYKNYLCNFDYKPEDYEIIGNIYKNPELLNEVE